MVEIWQTQSQLGTHEGWELVNKYLSLPNYRRVILSFIVPGSSESITQIYVLEFALMGIQNKIESIQ